VREACDLNALIGDLLRTRRLTQRLQATVRLELAAGLPTVPADGIGIEQVLTNLLRNASDAMASQPGRTEIMLRTQLRPADDDEPAAVRVTVCDNGPGLGGRSLDELCATFFSTKRGGMGLGLGICRAIVEQHGGRLVAADRPEGGACFSFELPVTRKVPMVEPS
jgi:two-component system, LuxR family, sensor histidine kinase DctS